jgi:hypothetical protein
VRDQRPHVIGVLGDERQRVHRTAAVREQVDRSAPEFGHDPMYVVGVILGRRRDRRLGQRTALASAGVVGHHGAVGEVAGQGAEAGRAHGRGDEEQNRLGALVVAPDVVGQSRAGDLERFGRWRRCGWGHGSLLDGDQVVLR